MADASASPEASQGDGNKWQPYILYNVCCSAFWCFAMQLSCCLARRIVAARWPFASVCLQERNAKRRRFLEKEQSTEGQVKKKRCQEEVMSRQGDVKLICVGDWKYMGQRSNDSTLMFWKRPCDNLWYIYIYIVTALSVSVCVCVCLLCSVSRSSVRRFSFAVL